MTEQLVKIEQGKDYTVQAGDTRKSIAIRVYDNPNRWKLIEEANKQELENLHRHPLPEGMVLHIPVEGGGDGISAHIEQGKDYTVQAGDTRKSIAVRVYHNPDRWKLIEEANKQELENFHERRLPIRMVLHIPVEGGGDGISAH
jgi:nucleoid-associated protein YgaU